MPVGEGGWLTGWLSLPPCCALCLVQLSQYPDCLVDSSRATLKTTTTKKHQIPSYFCLWVTHGSQCPAEKTPSSSVSADLPDPPIQRPPSCLYHPSPCYFPTSLSWVRKGTPPVPEHRRHSANASPPLPTADTLGPGAQPFGPCHFRSAMLSIPGEPRCLLGVSTSGALEVRSQRLSVT